jgi:hypothetical protein
VDVDRRARLVLEVVDGGAVAADGSHQVEGGLLADAVGRPGQRPVLVREARDHRDQAQRRRAPQSVRQDARDLLGPQELVLDVDEPPRALERLDVGAGDAALTLGGERQARALRRIGPQDLHRVLAGGAGVGQRLRQRAGMARLRDPACQAGAPRVAVVERGGVLPALAEGGHQVPDGRAADLRLHIVPRRPGPVASVQQRHLRVAEVALVVAAAVAEVDPAGEGHVVVEPAGVAQHHQLLVLGAGSPDPLVEQHLAAGVVDLVTEVEVGLLVEVRPRGVRAPQQSLHLDAAACRARQDLAQLGPGPVQALVGVAAPVRQHDQVAGAQVAQLPQEPGKVAAAVDQRLDPVAERPRPDAGRRVAALRRAQEPAFLDQCIDRIHTQSLPCRAVLPFRDGHTCDHAPVIAAAEPLVSSTREDPDAIKL